jgi:hypothetical protein
MSSIGWSQKEEDLRDIEDELDELEGARCALINHIADSAAREAVLTAIRHAIAKRNGRVSTLMQAITTERHAMARTQVDDAVSRYTRGLITARELASAVAAAAKLAE